MANIKITQEQNASVGDVQTGGESSAAALTYNGVDVSFLVNIGVDYNEFKEAADEYGDMLEEMDYIVAEANKINGTGGDEPVDQVLHVGSKCKFNGTFRVDEIILPNSKYPNGAVGSYATCYGSPVGNDDWIPSGPLATCNEDGSNEDYNGILEVGGYWKCDKVFTVVDVELPTKYTPNGVATLEADGIRFRVDCGPLLEV